MTILNTPTADNPLRIERIEDPAAFYDRHPDELAATGASAFGQPAEEFAPQVAERFHKATFADIVRLGRGDIIGFALYELLRGSHWRLAGA